jgi:hypothetical protein
MNTNNRTFYHFFRATVNPNLKVAIAQESDEHGNHRLVYYSELCFSEWANHLDFAKLSVPGIGQFIGTSEYYDQVLPRVFQIINNFED